MLRTRSRTHCLIIRPGVDERKERKRNEQRKKPAIQEKIEDI